MSRILIAAKLSYSNEFRHKNDKGDKMMRASVLTASALAIVAAPALAAGEAEPVTQTTDKGSYWVLNEALANDEGSIPASYTRVENLCITTDGRRFFGIQPASGEKPAMARTEGGPLQILVSPVDASAGKRHYRVRNPDNAEQYLILNFIAPGMREQDMPSATAGLSSVSAGEEYQIDCVDNDNIVLMMPDPAGPIIVTAEQGELVLRTAAEIEQGERELRGGVLAQDDQFSAIHFFDGKDRITFDLSRDGSADGHGITTESEFTSGLELPKAYFIADPEVMTQYATQYSTEVGGLVSRLSICNHFAGEASEDAERNAQIAVKWDEFGCDAVPAKYANALAAAPDDSGLKAYLKANSPNWI